MTRDKTHDRLREPGRDRPRARAQTPARIPVRAAPGPLVRALDVERLRREGGALDVAASPEECAALAAAWGIPGIRDLVGRFTLTGSLAQLQVEGTVEAFVTQTCGVSLDPFESHVSEPVEVAFTDRETVAAAGLEDAEIDVPDPIVNGRIDFGALTAEFLALGLDPYPRKPGIAFEPVAVDAAEGPLAGLRTLVPPEAE